MLVLTRHIGEKLVIGNDIIVEVVSISGDGVRLGITAPRETSVHRFEVFDEITAANQAASAFANKNSGSSLEDFAAHVRKGKNEEPGETK